MARIAEVLADPAEISEEEELVAGQLLAFSQRPFTNRTIARYAETFAKVIAKHGAEYARGWLAGLWYIGGVNPADDNITRRVTYHEVVWELQGYVSAEIVAEARR